MTPVSFQAQVRGANRLLVDASIELTHLIEELHGNLARASSRSGVPRRAPQSSLYSALRFLINAVGAGVDLAVSSMPSLTTRTYTSPQLDALRCALNGVVGDHLAETGNPLAIEMHLRHAGMPLQLDSDALGAQIGRPSRKLLVMVHGLCLGDMHWRGRAYDHAQALSEALGYTPLYLRYNTGLHISTNGRKAAHVIEQLVSQWPVGVDELVVVGHSMGGLLARSACDAAEQAGMRWREDVRKMVFLGAPHHGAPLERGGYWLHTLLGRHPLTAPLARLGRLRSAGITDLRRGCLRDEDWIERDRFEDPLHPISPVPLPDGVHCYALAGAIRDPLRMPAARVLGDGLVPIDSAFGDHEDKSLSLGIPTSKRRLVHRVGHLAMLGDREVGQQLHTWLRERPRIGRPRPGAPRLSRPRLLQRARKRTQ